MVLLTRDDAPTHARDIQRAQEFWKNFRETNDGKAK